MLHDLALMRLENLHQFLNLRDSFRFNVISHTRSVAIIVLEAGRKWSHCHAISHVYGFITLVIQTRGWCSSTINRIGFCLRKKHEKRKSALPGAIQVKNRRKAISTEDKVDLISRLEKGERIVDVCRNVRFTHTSVSAIRDNVDTITESAKSGTEVFV